MELLRTEQDVFTEKEILDELASYEEKVVPGLSALWDYYRAKNPAILKRETPDSNNPDNRTVVSYGRKIVNTFKGYGYRPGYIGYKSDDEKLIAELDRTFAMNHEAVKTSRTGRNTAIFGRAYEMLYVDKAPGAGMPTRAEPLFLCVDPRQMLVYYDYSPEPKIQSAIRFYPINKNYHRVEVLYAEETVYYDRKRSDAGLWQLTETSREPNRFAGVPVIAYYLGDEAIGIIEPVRTLIDDYDLLVSDSINEFDRFANAYLILKRFALTNPDKTDSESFSKVLQRIKRRRVFENVPNEGDVKFLLKDTPKDFIAWLAELVREEIHKQSHVPDFQSEKLGGDISGVAVARMMFDFENLISSAEGDFNIGLMERIRLILGMYKLGGRGLSVEESDIVISHKRNVPQNVKEFADTAYVMKQAGFSSYLIADIMPDDVIPDVEEELKRQKEERDQSFADVEMFQRPEEEEDEEDADEV